MNYASQLNFASNLKELLKMLLAASKELKEEIRDEFIGLALFGSWARNEAKNNSDVDVFIVLKTLEGLNIRSKIYKIIAKHVKKDVTLIDVRINELLKSDFRLTPIMINVIADAIVVWDENDVLKKFIEEGKELIRKAKLVRYKTVDGKYGWKKSDEKPLKIIES